MKVLVSGAGGFLGRYVVKCLLARGHSVRAMVRPASSEPSWNGHVEIYRADLRTRTEESLVSAFDGIDIVIHLAAATSGNEDTQFTSSVVATERFLEAMARSHVKRLVFVSSLVVYDWRRAKNVMDENTPLVTDVYEMGAYPIAKVWQERVVAKFAKTHSWDLTIMRPGFIWGPQHAEIGGMGRRVGRVNIMFGPLTRLPLTHVENCADCIVVAAENSAAAGEIFNVIDDDNVRVWRYVSEYSKRTGQRRFPLPIPYRVGLVVAQLANWTSKLLFGKKGKLPSLLTPRRYEAQFKPVRFNTGKLRKTLGWRPPFSFEECLKSTYGMSN